MRSLQVTLFAALLAASPAAFGHGDKVETPSLHGSPRPPAAIHESDVSLLLDYLRAAIRAASEGREPPPPPRELGKRMEELGSELKARGALAAFSFLRALEEHTQTLLQEHASPPRPRSLPPTVPYTPVSTDR
ncbi:MAG: hypothetical protein ACT4P8_07175 [Betaproteobacteria bacterium]